MKTFFWGMVEEPGKEPLPNKFIYKSIYLKKTNCLGEKNINFGFTGGRFSIPLQKSTHMKKGEPKQSRIKPLGL